MGNLRKVGSFMSSPVTLLVAAIFVAAIVLFLNTSSVKGLNDADFACSAGAFVLHGTVMNSSFLEATTNTTVLLNRSVNITAYNMSFANFGSKALTYVNSTFTNATTGNFSLTIRSLGDPASDCSQLYVFTVYYYNTSQGANPGSWMIEEIGPSFPILPKSALLRFFDNSTIYTQPAITLNITAVNDTHNISFNYAIFDNSLGFPIAESFASKVFNATAIVPRNRNYTIMMMVTPDFSNPGPNMFNTAAPPQSVALTNVSNVSSGYVFQTVKNLSFSRFFVYGNISVVGNTSAVNVSNILVKLSFNNMLPPNAVLSLPGGINITNMSSPVVTASSSTIAAYNVTVMGSTAGIDQVLEFFVSNTTSSSNNTQYFYAIQNFTVSAAVSGGIANVTLRQLAGNFSSQSQGGLTVPTSYVRINLTDSTGRPLTEAHMEMTVDNVGNVSGLGPLPQFRYMLDQLDGGVASLPLRLDANATLRVFSRRYAPLKYKINLTNASLAPGGITQITMNTFNPKRFQPNGTAEDFGGSKASQFKITFMKNSAACNVFNASVSACRLFSDDFDAGKFDPLKVMVSGKVNMLEQINTTGVILYFIGVDMMASGPPDGSISDSPLSQNFNKTTFHEVQRWGSAAPPIYDQVLVGVPYNASRTKDTNQVNFTIDVLYDNNGNVAWNSTTSSNSSIPSDWADYYTGWFNSTNGGAPCNNVDIANFTNATCFINTTTKYIWIKLPHFSDGQGGIQADPDTTPPAAPTPVNFTATPDGNVMVNWTDVAGETGESYIIYRSAFNITNATFGGPGGIYINNYTGINITNLTATTRVPKGVQFFIDNTTLNGSVFFYAVAAVDSNGNLQNSTGGQINLSSSPPVNITVNDTVLPQVPVNITLTASDTSVTITWLNVTQDVSGGADFYNLTYYIYRSAANETNVTLNGTANVTQANISTFVKSVPGTSNSTTVTGLSQVTKYHFAVVTVDDGGNQNLSVSFRPSGPSGNYANITTSATAASSGSSGSSGGSGGGGGGGTPAPSEGTKVSRKWDALPVGTTTMKITNAEVSFKTIDFDVGTAASNVEITITKLDSAPTNLKRDVQGTVFQYIRIDETNLKATDVTGAKIEFKVEKKWLDQKSGSIKNVVLQRYFNDLWTTLDTTYSRSDETYHYFTAASPGLSIFAVVLKPAQVASTAVNATANVTGAFAGTAVANATGQAPNKAKGAGSSSTLFVVLVVVAAAAGGLFLVIKKKGLGGLGGFGSGKRSRARQSDDEEAARIVKEYEGQRSERTRQQDQRGRPPEAFN